MRGLYFDAIVCDEMADFPASAWPTVLRPSLTDRKGMYFISTPKVKTNFGNFMNMPRQILHGGQVCLKHLKQTY